MLAGFSILLSTCNPAGRRASAYDVSDLKIEQKDNGYLVELVNSRDIAGIEAFITQSNWLVITVADASVDVGKVKMLKPFGIIQKIEVDEFATAVQISLKLSEKTGPVEIVRDPHSSNVYVSIFTKDLSRIKR